MKEIIRNLYMNFYLRDGLAMEIIFNRRSVASESADISYLIDPYHNSDKLTIVVN